MFSLESSINTKQDLSTLSSDCLDRTGRSRPGMVMMHRVDTGHVQHHKPIPCCLLQNRFGFRPPPVVNRKRHQGRCEHAVRRRVVSADEAHPDRPHLFVARVPGPIGSCHVDLHKAGSTLNLSVPDWQRLGTWMAGRETGGDCFNPRKPAHGIVGPCWFVPVAAGS